jgi:hypothetical protein
MRLTLIFLIATVLVSSLGVYYVNAHVGGTEDVSEEASGGALSIVPAAAAPPASVSVGQPIMISGCFESDGKCRCLDTQSRRVPLTDLSYADCRKMLEIGPK